MLYSGYTLFLVLTFFSHVTLFSRDIRGLRPREETRAFHHQGGQTSRESFLRRLKESVRLGLCPGVLEGDESRVAEAISRLEKRVHADLEERSESESFEQTSYERELLSRADKVLERDVRPENFQKTREEFLLLSQDIKQALRDTDRYTPGSKHEKAYRELLDIGDIAVDVMENPVNHKSTNHGFYIGVGAFALLGIGYVALQGRPSQQRQAFKGVASTEIQKMLGAKDAMETLAELRMANTRIVAARRHPGRIITPHSQISVVDRARTLLANGANHEIREVLAQEFESYQKAIKAGKEYHSWASDVFDKLSERKQLQVMQTVTSSDSALDKIGQEVLLKLLIAYGKHTVSHKS